MKQILQNFKTGDIHIEEVPPPILKDGFILVQNHYSLISTGTEGGTVKLGKMSLLGKARARPEQVRKVIKAIQTEGLLATYQAVTNTLDMPIPLGYSCAGEVIAVGNGVDGIQVGDYVACGGGGYANHAEIVSVPKNLCVPLPANMDVRYAAFTTLGSIALQSVRVAEARLGDNIVVIGLGLVGLLTAQILQAAGCNVFGIDLDPARVEFALQNGFCSHAADRNVPNLKEQVRAFSNGQSADVVIITAAAPSNDPVALAGDLVRFKGTVVVVGRTEMNAPRETYLFKELQLRTSLAYGPGTGDPSYEEKGHDYPIGYVRWTENRNMAAFVKLVADNKINLTPLITHQFDVTEAAQAYDLVTNQPGASIAVLLRYPQNEQPLSAKSNVSALDRREKSTGLSSETVRVGVIGAGSFATNFLIPVLASNTQVSLQGIASATGIRAKALQNKYNFAYCASNAEEIIADEAIDCVFILTRHDTHAALTTAALQAGKHVFVEKPLAMQEPELHQVMTAQKETGLKVMVGFNRRFAPLAVKLKTFFSERVQPLSISYRANVGYRPPEHWLHDPKQGGGVIIGEACHFIDFCHWLTESTLADLSVRSLHGEAQGIINADNVHIQLGFEDGSVATVTYLSNGSATYSRERTEVFGDNSVAVLEDFRLLELAGGGKRVKRERVWLKQQKGYDEQVQIFVDCIRSGQPVPGQDLYFEASLTTLRAQQALYSTNSTPEA